MSSFIREGLFLVLSWRDNQWNSHLHLWLAGWLWVLVGTQLLTPAALARAMLPEITRSGADSSADKTDQPEAEWLASRASSTGSLLQEGNISDFAKNQIQTLPQTIANDGITSGIKHWLPEAQFRGGSPRKTQASIVQQKQTCWFHYISPLVRSYLDSWAYATTIIIVLMAVFS